MTDNNKVFKELLEITDHIVSEQLNTVDESRYSFRDNVLYWKHLELFCNKSFDLIAGLTESVTGENVLTKYFLRPELERSSSISAKINKEREITISLDFIHAAFVYRAILEDGITPSLDVSSQEQDYLESLGILVPPASDVFCANKCFVENKSLGVFVEMFFVYSWVLYHEIGHYLCGHIDTSDSGYSIDEGTFFSDRRKIEPVALDSAIERWSQEFSADIYASIRNAMLSERIISLAYCHLNLNDLDNQEGNEVVITQMESIIQSAMFSGVYVISTLDVGRTSVIDYSNAAASLYQSTLSRFIAQMAAILNICHPLPNAQFDRCSNFTTGLVRVLGRSSYSQPIDDERSALNAASFKARVKFLGYLANLKQSSNWFSTNLQRGSVSTLLLSSTAWRIGRTSTEISKAFSIKRKAIPEGLDISEADTFWTLAMRTLCTRTNIKFLGNMPRDLWEVGVTRKNKEFTSKLMFKPLSHKALADEHIEYLENEEISETALEFIEQSPYTVDPAYQVLDSWLSQLYQTYSGGRDVDEGINRDMEFRRLLDSTEIVIQTCERHYGLSFS